MVGTFTPEILSQFSASENVSDFMKQLRELVQKHEAFKKIDILKKGNDSDLITHFLSILNKRNFQNLTESNIAISTH